MVQMVTAFHSAAWSMDDFIDTSRVTAFWHGLDWSKFVSSVVTASVSGIVCLVLPLAETEKLWAKLNGAMFLFIASGTLLSFPFLPALGLGLGQFGIHWMFHRAIHLRERRADWAWQMARAEREARPIPSS